MEMVIERAKAVASTDAVDFSIDGVEYCVDTDSDGTLFITHLVNNEWDIFADGIVL